MHGGDFLRVRVAVNVLEPLCRGRRVTFNDDSNGWVSSRYERLPNFCFWCGHLDHIDKGYVEKSFVEVKGFSSFTSSTPSSSRLNVIECPDDGNSMDVVPSMVEQRGKGGLDQLKGCSDVPGINSTCLDVVSTREVSPNVVEKLTALVSTNYELPSTSIVAVSNSNKVSKEENPVSSNEIGHKKSEAVKDRVGDCGLTDEGAKKGDVKKGNWARRGNRPIESPVSVESADLLGLKWKSSLVAVETQDVGDTEKKTKEYVGAKKLSIKAVQDRIERWCPPPENMYKVNVDGAIFSAKKEAEIGIVVWDCHGLVMDAMSMKVSALLGPLEVEAKAFEVGLQFAKDLGIQDFISEGDSLNVYRALAGLSHKAAVDAPIIYGILDSCNDIHNVRFSHVKRKGNTHAHLLAKHACGIVDYLVWMEENPCFLEQALHHDVISF
ncbi:hypothetical protein SO802_012663 [Lithocarpus litseifolius]|uniref:RNase H type-1 domain-containing protein n=1 Tax=Lithocarpus litseifolius TaxID=425828 RepID=A0AAW2D5J5_9ROSI